MTLWGDCSRCESHGVRLHFRPDKEVAGGRPSVCSGCKYAIERRMEELREERDLLDPSIAPPYQEGST